MLQEEEERMHPHRYSSYGILNVEEAFTSKSEDDISLSGAPKFTIWEMVKKVCLTINTVKDNPQ